MAFLLGKDTISGKEGMLFATVNGQVKEIAECRNVIVTLDKTKSEIHTLGERGTQYKATGYTGTGTLEVYTVTSFWTQLLVQYAKTGVDTYFSLQLKNNDPGSAIGTQRLEVYNVNLDGGDLAKLDVDAEFLSNSYNFTWTGTNMPEVFGDYTTVD